MPYQGVPCTLRNAKSGQYAGTRNFCFVSRGAASGIAKEFINFARSDPTALRIVASDWVPAPSDLGAIAARLPGAPGGHRSGFWTDARVERSSARSPASCWR